MNNPSPDNPVCIKCGLFNGCKTPFMQHVMSRFDTNILIVEDTPDDDEDRKGILMSGAAGTKLKGILTTLDINTDYMAITTAVRCRPDDGKISKKSINHCRQFLLDEIEELNPKYVMLLGNSSLESVLNQHGITTWNGVVVERDDRTYIPMYHPTYVSKNPHITDAWLEGFVKLSDMLDGEDAADAVAYEYRYPKTVKDVREMIDALQIADVISFDLETTSLDPFAKDARIIAVTCAANLQGYTDEKIAWAFPFDHKDGWWTQIEKKQIARMIEGLLHEHKGIVGHNIKFDRMHARRYGWEFESFADTMLLSALVDSRSGIHSLKRLAGVYLGMYDYDKELDDYKQQHREADPKRGGTYEHIPLEILLPYACMDSHATLELYPILCEKLSTKQKLFHDEIFIRASDALCDIEYNGIQIDHHIAERYYLIYGTIQQRIYAKLVQDKLVKRMIKWYNEVLNPAKIVVDALAKKPKGAKTRTDEEVLELYDYFKTHSTISLDEDFVYIAVADGKSKKLKRKFTEFNPNSVFQLRRLLFHYYKIPENEVDVTDTGMPSTKAKGLKKLVGRFPILMDIVYYKLLTKMIGTYLRPAAMGDWESDDGFVRSNYNLNGAVTGRLASSDPNLQNIPTADKEPDTLLEWLPIKNIFTSRFEGGFLVSLDYSGMELRVFASESECEAMMKIHRSKLDFHSVIGIRVRDKLPIEDIVKDRESVHYFKKHNKKERYKYKWTNWTLMYGGDAWTLYNLYPDDFESLDEAQDVVDGYFESFPEVLEYLEKCVDFAKIHGYIESSFGRREHLPYLFNGGDPGKVAKDRRSAVNMPIQSAASDILLCALIVINKEIKARGLESLVVNTVHDSIVFDCPNMDEVKQVIELATYIMENIVEVAKVEFPNIDFSWFTAPLQADADYGTHYGALQEWTEEVTYV